MAATKKNELVADYRKLSAQMTHQERAELEAQIYKLAPKGDSREKRRWLTDQISVSSYEYQRRATLLQLGTLAGPLWEQLEKGMTLRQATHIIKNARAGVSKYDSIALTRNIDKGVAEHRERQSRSRVVQAAVEAPKKKKKRERKKKPDNERQIWSEIRQDLLLKAGERLAPLEERQRSELLSDFERDLKNLCEHHQHRWYRALQGIRTKVSRQVFIKALRVLHMDPPRRNEPLDGKFLARARRQQRSLARHYHPDRMPETADTRAAYEAVIQAYSRVEQFIQENEGVQVSASHKTPDLHVVQGGKEK